MGDQTDTWREMLTGAMAEAKDEGPVLVLAPDEASFDVQFDSGYGHAQGPPVLAWTETRVYFPVVYDGAEWLDSVPRNPRDTGQPHVGGQ